MNDDHFDQGRTLAHRAVNTKIENFFIWLGIVLAAGSAVYWGLSVFLHPR